MTELIKGDSDMTTKQTTTSTVHRIRRSSEPAAGSTKALEGKELIRDMRRFRKEVTATPASARKFLIELGVLTPEGKKKSLIRG